MNVIDSIYSEPEKWKARSHTLIHEGGTEVWLSNMPIFDTNLYPSAHMSMLTKVRLWMAIRWWSANKPV